MIAELALPRAQVDIETNASESIGSWKANAVVPKTPKEEEDEGRTVEQARRFLKTLVGQDPVWLSAASSFSVAVTPRQLRSLVASPLFRRIHPDRMRS